MVGNWTDVTADFWVNYMRNGVCSLGDNHHNWVESNGQRECQYCKLMQKKEDGAWFDSAPLIPAINHTAIQYCLHDLIELIQENNLHKLLNKTGLLRLRTAIDVLADPTADEVAK